MKYISEERLREIGEGYMSTNAVNALIRDECKELDVLQTSLCPWQPIESAPWNKPLLVFYPTMEEGLRIRVITRRVNFDSSLHKPTHWQELPEDNIEYDN